MHDSRKFVFQARARANKRVTGGLAARTFTSIGADSTGATGNFAPVLTQEPGKKRFAPVPFMAVL